MLQSAVYFSFLASQRLSFFILTNILYLVMNIFLLFEHIVYIFLDLLSLSN
jgi:hypothetical protein